MTDRTKWKILGRIIGTCTTWNSISETSIMIFDFEPAENVPLPKGDLCVNFESGLAAIYDDEGKELECVDLIETLINVPKGDLE